MNSMRRYVSTHWPTILKMPVYHIRNLNGGLSKSARRIIRYEAKVLAVTIMLGAFNRDMQRTHLCRIRSRVPCEGRTGASGLAADKYPVNPGD